MKERVVILGSGESGMGAAILASSKGLDVFLSDFGKINEGNKSKLEELGVPYEEERHTLDRILQADTIVKSPGIPDTVSVVQHALAKGIPVISEIEFAFRYVPENTKVIAITGTNGKTTTTMLTYHLLATAGLDVAVAGNIGESLAAKVAKTTYDYLVIEVSSFQLDGILTFKPDIAVLLNITPDHLDRYEYDFSRYVASKFRITENLTKEECFIYCSDSIPVNEELSRRKMEACLFAISATKHQQEGAYIDNEHLIFNYKFKAEKRNARIPVSEIKLIGRHNMLNTMAAVLSALVLDISVEKILKGLKSFENAPHRMEKVGVIDGVTYINDSKATNVDSVYYALDAINEPIIWVVGGVDKGNDYGQIAGLVQENWKIGILENRNIGKLENWNIGILENRIIGE
jgi:UDP-N-acetylmuramoylalanine--D-glutamate ligase